MKKLKFFYLLIIGISTFTILSGCQKKSDTIQEEKDSGQKTSVTPEVKEAAKPDPEGMEKEGEAIKEEKLDMNIAALKGPTAIGMVKIMEDGANGKTANPYQFTIAGAADEISTGLIKGDIDIAAVPCNLASVLYNKTEGKIKMAGINTLGVLYIVETGNTIETVKDLKGKTIYSTGLGTTPQYTLNYLLTANGIDPEKDVTIEYKSEPTEVAALLSNSEDAVAMLPQPYVTTVMMNNDKVRIALDITKEWETASTDGSSVITGVVVVRKEFLDNNKEAFDTFMEEYTKSAAFVNENVEGAAKLVEKFDIFKAAVASKAIPYCNITLIKGEGMKEKVNGYLTVLFNQEPKSVGGKVPGDDFYYIP